MKEPIIAILSWPFENKYVVKVFRGDNKHQPIANLYMSNYSDTQKTVHLGNQFNKLNSLLTAKLLNQKLEKYQKGAQNAIHPN